MSHYVEPLADDVMFSQSSLAAACHLAERDPLKLTDYQLRMIATYSQGDAESASRKREAAYLKSFNAPPVRQGTPPTPAAAPAFLPFFNAMAAVIREALAVRDKRIAALETRTTVNESERFALTERVAKLEAAAAKGVAGVRWAGVHEAGKSYREGELVSRGGLWLCKAATTTAAPGANPEDWVLIVRAKSKDVE